MTQKIIFRKADEKDWNIIKDIEGTVASKLFFPLVKEEEIKDYIKNSTVIIMYLGEDPIGTVSFEEKKDGSIYFNGLTIKPEYQGRGYAKKAMEEALNRSAGKTSFVLSVHPENSIAIAIYLKLGFVIKFWKDDYYGDGEPRLVLVKGEMPAVLEK